MSDLEELIETIAFQLVEVRSLPVGSYPKDFLRPKLDALIGTQRAEILRNLGDPDHGNEWGKCNKISYFYFNPTPGMRGGGGYALEIDFDQHDRIGHAKWQLQR